MSVGLSLKQGRGIIAPKGGDSVESLINSLQQSMSAMEALKEPFTSGVVQMDAPPILKSFTATEVHKHLQRVITDFMDSLKPNEEVGIQLASFGVTHQIVVDSVRALGSNLLVFQGQENGLPTTLVQHVSQLNFLLVAVPLEQPGVEPRRKIGFYTE